jgi:hypothetical protein
LISRRPASTSSGRAHLTATVRSSRLLRGTPPHADDGLCRIRPHSTGLHARAGVIRQGCSTGAINFLHFPFTSLRGYYSYPSHLVFLYAACRGASRIGQPGRKRRPFCLLVPVGGPSCAK